MYNVYYMAILYHTAKFKSAKRHLRQIKIAKFSDRQYFRLQYILYSSLYYSSHKLYTVLALIILII